jgi:hypothetical protein
MDVVLVQKVLNAHGDFPLTRNLLSRLTTARRAIFGGGQWCAKAKRQSDARRKSYNFMHMACQDAQNGG